ncbi:uncharacterized protein LOC124372331 [Homalodisca vitripennis]|uniref:uncharacterized protein LOC124372331 n=1 Tax=Homalodisca vitripennis TaxID=197043 RepID=UPI001EEA485A|nr:uncharacterized protein LOC124372331 [Homalodisca vitripennis]
MYFTTIKYVIVAGDGDSSVMSKLTECQPYGPRTTIGKIECTNHLLRNYIRKIRDIGGQKRNHLGPVPGELRDKILSRLMRLRHAVTGAVKHHKSNSSYQLIHDTLKQLKTDIMNGPNHVFGDHSKCQPYFCKRSKNGEENYVELLKSYGVWQDIMAANTFLANFTYSLLQCITSNIAESYNAKVCKLVGGKRVNLVQRNSYTARSELSALSTNDNEEVHRHIYKKLASGHSPGIHSKTLAHRRCRRRTRTRKSLFREERTKKFRSFCADHDYGDVAAVDIEPDEFEHKKDTFLNSLKLDTETRTQLELDSRGQSTCELWKHERRKRLTASNFGKICRMKSTTPCQKTVEQLLYKSFVGNKAMRYGVENERNAIDELENLIGAKVEECGLFVDPVHPFLAASPDGIIDGKGLVEVKCPAAAKNLTPADAVRRKIIKFCKLDECGELKLKVTHSYYYQVQGQLHVTGKQFCLFTVWTPHGVSVRKNFEK